MALRRPRTSTTRKLTLRDVANHAGVSPMTVSNVINGRFGAMASQTRERVEQAIKSLNYRPHVLARELRLSRSFSIGIVLVDPNPMFLATPFTTQLVAGLSNYLSEHGYRLSIQGLRPEQFKDALALQNSGMDGICVMLSGTAEQRKSFRGILERTGQPTVIFQEFGPVEESDVCCICQEDYDGGLLIARHVIRRGATSLATIEVVHEWPALSERLRGIRDAVQEADGGVSLTSIVCRSSAMPDVELALRRHLEKHPVPRAILGTNDQMGLAAMHFLMHQKYRVPDDVMITGFNAFGFQAFAPVPLTSVRSPAYEMGARGGAEMLSRLSTGRFQQTRVLLPVTLEPGESA